MVKTYETALFNGKIWIPATITLQAATVAQMKATLARYDIREKADPFEMQRRLDNYPPR